MHTYCQHSFEGFYARYQENLKLVGMEETASTSFLLFARWYNSWGNCFDESGRKRMEFLD